jgi:hypothetical protein
MPYSGPRVGINSSSQLISFELKSDTSASEYDDVGRIFDSKLLTETSLFSG